MLIIIKFLLKNIYEKKFRTFLILFSVLMSSALFFSSLAISDNVVDMFLAEVRQFFGTSDIIIQANEKSPSSFFHMGGAEVIADNTEYAIGTVQGVGFYKYKRNESVTMNLRGTTIEDFQSMSQLYIDSGENLSFFTGNSLILSKNASDKYGFQAGDAIDLEINGSFYKFTICAIAQPAGYFAESGQSYNALVPKAALSSIYGYPGMSNMAFIKLKDPAGVQQALHMLEGAYKRYTVREPVSREEMEQQVGSISVGFMMMTVVVLFMSVFIIYTSFKVITMERLPVIGTFRSIGATRRTTDLVLSAESMMYGVIGGILGCTLGIGILYLIASAITPPWMSSFPISLSYTSGQLIAAFVLAVVLSLVSSIIPILKVSKTPVKEIVLNAIDRSRKNKSWKYVLGVILLAISFIVPPMAPKGIALVADTISMLLSVSSVILLVPLLTKGFLRLFEKIYTSIFGNIGILAAKNLRENKSILNNISLLAIGISSLIMITTVSDSVMLEVSSFFTRTSNFQVWMFLGGTDRSFEQSLLAVEGITGVYGNFEAGGIEVVGQREKIAVINGVNTGKYLDYQKTDMEGDPEDLLHELDEGRNIIITNMLREKYGLRKGDYINLKMKHGNVPYKVIGFHNTILNGGSNALISDKYFKIDTGDRYYSNIYIKTDRDPSEVADAVKKKFARLQPYILTMSELEKMNYEMNSKVFNTMKAFSIMTLIIGIFGIFNNYIISFIERKRSLAMYRSIGMSKRQIVKMLFIESLTGGIIGGALGVLSGMLMVYCIPYVMAAMEQPIPVYIGMETIIISFVAGAVITLIASISPTSRSSKLKIIEALKYE